MASVSHVGLKWNLPFSFLGPLYSSLTKAIEFWNYIALKFIRVRETLKLLLFIYSRHSLFTSVFLRHVQQIKAKRIHFFSFSCVFVWINFLWKLWLFFRIQAFISIFHCKKVITTFINNLLTQLLSGHFAGML